MVYLEEYILLIKIRAILEHIVNIIYKVTILKQGILCPSKDAYYLAYSLRKGTITFKKRRMSF